MEKQLLIVQNSIKPLSLNENVSITTKKGVKPTYMTGIFTEFDKRNRNERIYTAEKFLPCLDEMNSRITEFGGVFGEYDHPDVFDTKMKASSHMVTKATYNQELNLVEGEIRLMPSKYGEEVKKLILEEFPIFVSSRAAGVTESDGTVTLKKLFTYDIVADPGFASAKMNIHSLNESLGFKNNTNFRIYEMSDESKINDAFNMNTNEFVTKQQMTEYSQHLVEQLALTKLQLGKAIKEGKTDPSIISKMAGYCDELRATNSKVVKYLDYLSGKLQSVVNENISLKETTSKLIKHNDYLAEHLENNIKYSTYIAENLDNNIKYNEYIAEHLENTIKHSDYLAENIEMTIEFSDYLVENLNSNINYNEHIAEKLNDSIKYAKYIAEHLDGNINYSQYIAEHLDDTIAYTDYVAEGLDKSIGYTKLIAEKLNNVNVNESTANKMPMPADAGIENIDDQKEVEKEWNDEDAKTDSTETPIVKTDESVIATTDVTTTDDTTTATTVTEDVTITTTITTDDDSDVTVTDDNTDTTTTDTTDVTTTDDTDDTTVLTDVAMVTPISVSEGKTTDLSNQIDILILEAKKRKASETTEHHFLKFLTKEQVESFYNLTSDEQETVVSYINENANYFSGTDVLNLMNESLSTKAETIEEKVVRLMPENIKPIWEQLNESAKKSFLTQARIHPNIQSDQMIEHFWMTRNLKKNDSVNKELVNESKLIDNDSLSTSEYEAIIARINQFK